MSASEALARDPGAVSRRLPGHRVRAPRWLVPPLVALAVVVAVNGPLAPTITPSNINEPINPPVPNVDPLADTRPPAEIVPVSGVDTSDVDRRIDFWQNRLEAQPRSNTAWANLGALLELRGRQTGVLADYLAAREAFDRAVEIAPRSASALVGQARMLATLHDFSAALAAAAAALRISPGATGALAVQFDASLELGDLDSAGQLLAELSERVPSPSITLRAARLESARGNATYAAELAHSALADAEALGEAAPSLAFYAFAAAEHSVLAVDAPTAMAAYERALRELPAYPPALAGMGRLAYAAGDLDAAINWFEQAVAVSPRPDLATYLGDLYAQAGDTVAAEAQYAVAERDFRNAAEVSNAYDEPFIQFLADHGRDLALAVELAEASLARQADAHAYETLAWALHASGRGIEALEPLAEALAFGIPDAELLIRAGLIEMAAGETDQGRRHIAQGLASQPAFSPLVVAAARAAIGR